MKKIVMMLVTPFFLSVASAELPPEAYRNMQMKSPEYLELRVVEVSRGLCIACSRQKIEVKAEVLRVLRTATALKPGERICIRYSHYRPRRGWTGPSPIPVLREGQTCPAFLKKTADERCYEPAAGGSSFRQPVSEK